MRLLQSNAGLLLLWLLLGLVAGCATKPAREPAHKVSGSTPAVSVSVPAAPASSSTPPTASAPPTVEPTRPADYLQRVGFNDIPGWTDDDQREAWAPMLASCRA
ncbi:MAG: hypothetical protein EBV69_05145, partial [Oxalobacteraceae bacterium]|nr:hypothetical protein [Oxalobacteraceae bacterium]